jgi:pre-mRNA-processing factor 17
VLKTFSTGKVPYVVKFHPDEDKQNVVLAGMSDKKIVQWDSDTGEITQEYDEHLGAVNTITFVDDNKRFVTSSDDKSLRVWDWNIPVVIKYISEPTMHSMPAVTMHPDGKGEKRGSGLLCFCYFWMMGKLRS